MKNVKIKVTANYSKRTFTIRKESAKFRTLEMSQNEFDECEYNTTEDWEYFLRTQGGSYYEVKK